MKIDRIANIDRIKNDKLDQRRHPGSFPGQGDDNLAVSDVGRLSQQIEAVVRKTPEVRAETVESLQRALAAGTYKINARAIARKILEG